MTRSFAYWTVLVGAVAILLGQAVDQQGGLWSQSGMFFTLLTFGILFRVIWKIKFDEWKLSHEWIFFTSTIFLLFSLWWWIDRWDIVFLIMGIAALLGWL